jgi:hypothetical protein
LTRRDAELDANPAIALAWEQLRASVEPKPLNSFWNPAGVPDELGDAHE